MKRILIVDRQPVTRIGLGQVLRELSPTPELIESGEDELVCSILRCEPCDGVILDLDLGQEDGIELIKRIRRQQAAVAILPHV